MYIYDWFLVVVSIFVPPITVWLKRGFFTKDFLINVLLLLFGFIPSLIHSLYIISKYPYIRSFASTLSSDPNNHTHTNNTSSINNTDDVAVDHVGYGSIV